MNNIYTIAAEYNGNETSHEEPIRIFKGVTEIFFNLSQILTGSYEITKLIIDFNDDTPLYKKYYSFGDKKEINNIISHTYHPSVLQQNIVYYPTLFISFSNTSLLIYQATIKISKESFFTEYKRLSISSCQFIDNSDNSMFVTFDTAKGDILNLKIK